VNLREVASSTIITRDEPDFLWNSQTTSWLARVTDSSDGLVRFMICQKCGRYDATVHREATVFRQKIEEHLCPLCAGTGLPDSMPSGKKFFEPELVPNGLAALPDYVSRFFALPSPGPILIVGTPSHSALMIVSWGMGPEIQFSWKRDPELEPNVRNFFIQRGAQPTRSGPRALCYALPASAEEAIPLTAEILDRCFHVKQGDPLTFTLAD